MFKARLNIYACKKLDPVPLCPAAFLLNASRRTPRSAAPKKERIETNGDGVKPGSPLAGHGGANAQLECEHPS